MNKHIVSAEHDGERILLRDRSGALFELSGSADCCASCFIEDVLELENLVDATITEAQELQLSHVPDHDMDADEAVETWGVRLHTAKGTTLIGMRLEHNGFYGGSLDVWEPGAV